MNGAESVVRTLIKGGVDTCFANPGTSEMHFVAALDQIPGMRCVLGLHETVVTGMADGYFRIAGKPACTLLHCGPGLANGLANLHNARRAKSGIINIVGDQATYHRPYDAPLTTDTEALARTVSYWTRTSESAAAVGNDTAAAIEAATAFPGQIATLILPSDVSWNENATIGDAFGKRAAACVDPFVVETAARVLKGPGKVLLLLGSGSLGNEAQGLAWRVANATGASLMADYVVGQVARGNGRLALERVPYNTDAAVAALAAYSHIILVGSKPPVGFFAYPGKPSAQHAPHTQLHYLSRVDQDSCAALRALAHALRAPEVAIPAAGPRPSIGSGKPTTEGLAQTVAAVMPDNAIISDESLSFGRAFYPNSHNAPPHDWLHLAGGAIGDGLPVATGAAIAGRGRRVISLQADGSGMYSLQALWTQARERLPVTTIILNNRKYNILIGEYHGVGAIPGPTAMSMLDLSRPDLDWTKLGEGMGVESAQANNLEECAKLMKYSFSLDRPFLIDLVI